MDRSDFETLRDIPGKRISSDIRYARRQATAPVLVVDDVRIDHDGQGELRLHCSWNPETSMIVFNVHVPGVGPICRLCVDGPAHAPAGRSHKHALVTERCPGRNLPDGVVDRPDLSGQPVADVFTEFCRISNIEMHGRFFAPDVPDGVPS